MLRLFISLYLVIILGISLINSATEYLWQQIAPEEQNELSFLTDVIESTSSLISNDLEFIQYQQQTNFTLTKVAINDIAWLDEQQKRLHSGKSVVIYTPAEALIVYIKSSYNDDIYQFGPFITAGVDEQLKYVLMLFSYILLAIIIILWTKPIWRDLLYLSAIAKQIDNNEQLAVHPVKSRSAISPIVKTIQQMATRIQMLIEEQKQFINSVSHELRTPLSRLRFSIALLESSNEKIENSNANNRNHDIEQDVKEIETLIDELLSYARLEHISQQQMKTPVNISAVITEQCKKLQRGTVITLNNKIQEDIVCACNQHLFDRATQNLITNALKFAHEKVNVEAHIDQSANLLIVTITDDGPGVPEELLNDLFEPFKRADKNNKHSGYGLGLSIVKKAALWHNGTCTVRNSSHGGAIFSLMIPIS